MKKKIFLSYAHKDGEKVMRVAEHLTKLGFDVWIDKHKIKGGDLWSNEIAHAIESCQAFILFISKSSMKSDPVRRESDLAYTHKRKMILVRFDDAKIPSVLAYQTSGIQWIDAREENWMEQLLEALRARRSLRTPSPKINKDSNAANKTDTGGIVHIKGNATNNVIIVGSKNKVGRS